MKEIDPTTFIILVFSLGCIFFMFWLFTQTIDMFSSWLDEREEAKKSEIKRAEPLRLKKYLTVKNYLITLATLATIGIVIIAIKLL